MFAHYESNARKQCYCVETMACKECIYSAINETQNAECVELLCGRGDRKIFPTSDDVKRVRE